MSDYPTDRTDAVPGDDIASYSMDTARAASLRCPFCHGDGLATTFNPNYDRRVSIPEFDRDGRERQKLMRTVSFCSCICGRKTMALVQQQAKDVFKRIPDIYDVLNERYPDWMMDDPSETEMTPTELAAMPEKFRQQLTRIRDREFDFEA